MNQILALFIIALGMTSPAWAAENNAVTGKNLIALQKAAEAGDAQSQLEYGKAIRNKSRKEAALWIQKAADQGLGEAWFWLGYEDLGKEQPIFYYKKAAEKGYAEAFNYLLDDLLFSAGSSADVEEAKKYADLARKLNIEWRYDSDEYLRTFDRCYEAGSAEIPASDQPTREEIAAFRNSKIACFSYRTGVGAQQDWINYRKCLLSKIDGNDNTFTGQVSNNDIAEIYANGWGVKRNAKLALALVCHGGSAPAELVSKVNALYSTKDQERLQPEFRFCNHITSGYNSEFCAARNEEIEQKKRELEFNEITLHWTALQKERFNILQKIAEDFFFEHARSEQDMSGSARGQFFYEELEKLRNEFLNSVKLFEAGQLPTDTDFVEADNDLNHLYSRLLNKKFDTFPGAVTKDGIRSTQRKWLTYRDAFVKFAEVRYPGRSADVWKTWATKQRIKQLNEVESNNFD